MFLRFIFVFLLTLLVIKLLRPLARKIGLQDKPDVRKQHEGVIPLIGGIGLYVSMTFACIVYFSEYPFYRSILVASGVMVLVGALDDKFGLSVIVRVFAALMSSLIMMLWGDNIIINLGDLFGRNDILLPLWVAIPFTSVAVFGVINALNMADGIDGMAGSLALLTLASIQIITDGSAPLSILISVMIAGLSAFLFYNLQVFPPFRKIFLGDAGSMLLGLLIAWFLVNYSQNSVFADEQFQPVTALFLLGLPLMDMVSTVLRRALNGHSPFKADRTHVHHILLASGLTQRQVLGVIVILGGCINLIGIILSKARVNDTYQLIIYLSVFVAYYKTVKYGFLLSGLIHKRYTTRISHVQP